MLKTNNYDRVVYVYVYYFSNKTLRRCEVYFIICVLKKYWKSIWYATQ